MKPNKKTTIKQQQHSKKYSKKNTGSNSRYNQFIRILSFGILVCVLTLTVSLVMIFHPFTMEDVKQQAKAFKGVLLSATEYMAEKRAEKAAQRAHESTASADSAAAPDQEETDSSSFLEISEEIGNIGDLDLNHFPDMPDNTYIVMLDTAAGPLLYYNQGDDRWRDYLYGGADPMSKYGCGPTAVSMVINSLTPSAVTPVEMADWAASQGYYAPQGGSYHSLIPDSLTAFGLKPESVTDYSYEHVSSLLKEGHILVALMGRGSLTQNGHFILITQLLEDGTVTIADPNSYENSTKKWDLNQLLSELKRAYDSGGPLWSVTAPSVP